MLNHKLARAAAPYLCLELSTLLHPSHPLLSPSNPTFTPARRYACPKFVWPTGPEAPGVNTNMEAFRAQLR